MRKTKKNSEESIIQALLPRLATPIYNLLKRPSIGNSAELLKDGFCEVPPFKGGHRSAACVSADFELAWAWRMVDPRIAEQKANTARENFDNLLKMLDKYEVPVTWATVGHLFLSKCEKGENGLAHPDMIRPMNYYQNAYWSHNDGDWYKHDPCSNFTDDPLWYAPDIIAKIITSPTGHELATHTFSHIDCSDKNCQEELARAEINACKSAMNVFGAQPKSIAFPGNFVGNLNTFYDCGVIAFRGNPSFDLSYPIRNQNGIWNIPGSQQLYKSNKFDFFKRSKKLIEMSIKHNCVYHLFFHPSDEFDLLFKDLKKTLKYLHSVMKRERIWMATMSDIAEYCEARKNQRIKEKREDSWIIYELKNEIDQKKFDISTVTLKFNVPVSDIDSVKIEDKSVQMDSGIYQNDKTGFFLDVPIETNEIRIALKRY